MTVLRRAGQPAPSFRCDAQNVKPARGQQAATQPQRMIRGLVMGVLILTAPALPAAMGARSSRMIGHPQHADRTASIQTSTSRWYGPRNRGRRRRHAHPGIALERVDPSAAVQSGTASWYGPRFQGRKQASGEPFDSKQLTVAHRTLPFGTKIRVTNLKNNQSAILTVTDRGPHNRRRLVDVSRSAATLLGFGRRGVIPVQVAVVSLPDGTQPGTTAAQPAAIAPLAAAIPKK
jgi:rare lipoprotein A